MSCKMAEFRLPALLRKIQVNEQLGANLPHMDDDLLSRIVLLIPVHVQGEGAHDMKFGKTLALAALGYLLAMQQAFAGTAPPNPVAVPEIDGTGAVVAIGLVAGLVALVREKFFRK